MKTNHNECFPLDLHDSVVEKYQSLCVQRKYILEGNVGGSQPRYVVIGFSTSLVNYANVNHNSKFS